MIVHRCFNRLLIVSLFHPQAITVGEKLSASDGLTCGSDGKLYYGAFTNNAVVSWDPSTPLTPANQIIVAQDKDTMQWQDTFAFDNQGNLYFTTNRLQLYFTVCSLALWD